MNSKKAILALANGQVFEGFSIGSEGSAVGELVFNTAMTGYQEILTDPSYTGQIVMLTMAHVGNTGCNPEDEESARVWAKGLVVNQYTKTPSNYRATYAFPDWLKRHGIVAIAEIDTRALTIQLRQHGAVGAVISTTLDKDAAIEAAKQFKGLNGVDLASEVSRQTLERWDSGRGHWATTEQSPARYHVVAYDFGIKNTMLRILHERGCHLTVVPAKTSAEEVFALNPDGILLSNGPGDPAVCDYAIEATKKFIQAKVPVLGICLGFQILGLALGAKTVKMKFGHHGANHPLVDLIHQRVLISSQNHGFMIDESTLPETVTVTHRSLFDNTIQGLSSKDKYILGFQGHPEAGPGPHDMEPLFAEFIAVMAANSNIRKEEEIPL